MTVAVKICGITRTVDATVAAHAGARAIGFIFHPQSPRSVQPEMARTIVRSLPPFVTPVGVFVDPDRVLVDEVLRNVQLGLLQFHGDESAEFCESFPVPYVKAVRVRPNLDLLQYATRFPAARGLLLDTFVASNHGGTGKIFDWSLIPPALPLPIVLSGGLNADNVGEAIRRVRPWAVDVSSGVEAGKGIKDAAKIAAFMRGVRDADV